MPQVSDTEVRADLQTSQPCSLTPRMLLLRQRRVSIATSLLILRLHARFSGLTARTSNRFSSATSTERRHLKETPSISETLLKIL
nr:MAG TPA: hypothetical protein [Caudoviricetes sp.]